LIFQFFANCLMCPRLPVEFSFHQSEIRKNKGCGIETEVDLGARAFPGCFVKSNRSSRLGIGEKYSLGY